MQEGHPWGGLLVGVHCPAGAVVPTAWLGGLAGMASGDGASSGVADEAAGLAADLLTVLADVLRVAEQLADELQASCCSLVQ